MASDMNISIDACAADWLLRQRDPDFADWDDFATWLEEDAAHVAAFDRLSSLDSDLDALPKVRPGVAPAAAPQRRAPTRRAWFGGAIAAALVGVVSFSVINPLDNSTRIETAAGEHRTLTLADGSRIAINGASVIALDDDRPRFARLESGEAMFEIIHNDSEPFVVEAGDARLVDLGTAFNVVRRGRHTDVAVSEGVVAFRRDRHDVRIDAGKGLAARDGAAAPPKPFDVDVANVGGWRSGQFVYTGAALGDVAQDLRRTTGMSISLSSDVATRPFHGALVVGNDRDRAVEDLAALAGVRAEKQPDGWLLTR